MEFYTIFNSDSNILNNVWEKTQPIFVKFENLQYEDFTQNGLDFYCFIRAYTILTADTKKALELINGYLDFLSNQKKDSREILVSCFMMPSSILWFYKYTQDASYIKALLEKLYCLIFPIKKLNFTPSLWAYSIGAKNTINFLENIIEVSPKNDDIIAEIASFQKFHFLKSQKNYYTEDDKERLRINILPFFFGFQMPDCTDECKRYIMDQAFFLSKDEKIILYDAFAQLEYWTGLYPSFIEGGAPREHASFAQLAPFLCMVEHLIGIDLPMLYKGIECFTAHLPLSFTYSLTLPSKTGFVEFTYISEIPKVSEESSC